MTVITTVPTEKRKARKKATVAAAKALTAVSVTISVSSLLLVGCMITTINKVVATIIGKAGLQKNSVVRANGRYIRGHGLPFPEQAVWQLVDRKGDEMEFFHFTSLTRESFNGLVDLCKLYIVKHSIQSASKGPPRSGDLKRRKFQPRDVMAMTLKYLLSKAETKDLHVQFGASATSYQDYIILGMQAIVDALSSNDKAKVYWDRSIRGMKEAAKRTAQFLDIPNVVAMIDGNKLESFNPQDYLDQNRDWNGWTRDANRNLVLVWDPFGKIVDAAVNTPGNFHDSRAALWCNIYDHITSLPEGFKVVCDDAFKTQGGLKGKLIKTKEEYKGDGHKRSSYDQTLTHLRQCSEWGNNILTGVFRRLRTNLPTDNIRRGYIMWTCILLHNWRTETVGRNQIRTYFDDIVNPLNLKEEVYGSKDINPTGTQASNPMI